MQRIDRDVRARQPSRQGISAEHHRQLRLAIDGERDERARALQIVQVDRLGHGVGRHVDDPRRRAGAQRVEQEIGQ